jgi:hypothetical protein
MADDLPAVLTVVDGLGEPQKLNVGQDGLSGLAYQMNVRVRGGIVTDLNPQPTVGGFHTPAAGTATQIVLAGVAVVAITGPVRGGFIVNPEALADQGIAVLEQLYVDPVNMPGSAPGSGCGTCSAIDAGQTWSLPCAIPAGVAVRVNGASAGHKFTVVVWS